MSFKEVFELVTEAAGFANSPVDVAHPNVTNRNISKAWPNVSYKGKPFFDTYVNKWITEVETYLARENRSDGNNGREYQEVYLGYDSNKDIFYMGFDGWMSEKEIARLEDEEFGEYDDNASPKDNNEKDRQKWRKNNSMVGPLVSFKVDAKTLNITHLNIWDEGYGSFYSKTGTYKQFKRNAGRNVLDIRLD